MAQAILHIEVQLTGESEANLDKLQSVVREWLHDNFRFLSLGQCLTSQDFGKTNIKTVKGPKTEGMEKTNIGLMINLHFDKLITNCFKGDVSFIVNNARMIIPSAATACSSDQSIFDLTSVDMRLYLYKLFNEIDSLLDGLGSHKFPQKDEHPTASVTKLPAQALHGQWDDLHYVPGIKSRLMQFIVSISNDLAIFYMVLLQDL